MIIKPNLTKPIVFIAMFALAFSSCSKKDSSTTPPVVDPCAGKTITITATPTSASACAGGSVVASAAGSTSFTYKLNSTGTYQPSGTFTSVLAGTYTLFAKDGAGCEKSVSVTVQIAGVAGPLFSEVKSLLAARCQSCHRFTGTSLRHRCSNAGSALTCVCYSHNTDESFQGAPNG